MVSSGHSDPLSMFNSLVNQQSTQQTQNPSKIPRWFCPGTLRYYVLLHDVIEGEDAKYDINQYQSLGVRCLPKILAICVLLLLLCIMFIFLELNFFYAVCLIFVFCSSAHLFVNP